MNRIKIYIISLCMILIITIQVFSFDYNWFSIIKKSDSKGIKKELNSIEKQLKKNSTDAELFAKAGICYHLLAQMKNKVAAKSVDFFKKSLEIKDDLFIQAYFGSALTLLGGEKKDLISLNKGLKIIDKAVKKSNNDPNIVILRISNSLSMPDFIFYKRKDSREEKVVEDLAFINQLIKNGSDNIDVEKMKYFQIHLLLRQEKIDEAKTELNNILSEYPDSYYSEKAKKLFDSFTQN